MRILSDALLDQFCGYIDLRYRRIEFRLNRVCGQLGKQHLTIHGSDFFPGVDHLIRGTEENGLDLLLRQGWRSAFFSIELVIALPDHPAVLVVAVPHLRSIPAAAAPTPDFAGKDVHRAQAVLPCFPAGHQQLNLLEGLFRDDGLVVAFYVVLGYLAFVLLFLFAQEVRGINLLEQRVASIFLVRQNAPDAAGIPFFFSAGCRDSLSRQRSGDQRR